MRAEAQTANTKQKQRTGKTAAFSQFSLYYAKRAESLVPQGFQGFTNQKIYSKKAKNLWQKQEKLQRKSKKSTAKNCGKCCCVEDISV